eukprot:sb/3479281/
MLIIPFSYVCHLIVVCTVLGLYYFTAMSRHVKSGKQSNIPSLRIAAIILAVFNRCTPLYMYAEFNITSAPIGCASSKGFLITHPASPGGSFRPF